MQNNPERSGKLFELATNFGLYPIDPELSIQEKALENFIESYRTWAKPRDVALTNYLTNNPGNCRVYLPFSSRVFGLALNVSWYYDEIIISDHLLTLINTINDLNKLIEPILQTLKIYSALKEQIQNGFILLGGFGNKAIPQNLPTEIINLSQDPEIIEAIKKNIRCGHTIKPDSLGAPTDIFTIELDSGGMMGFSTQPHPEVPAGTPVHGPSIKIGEPLPRIEYGDLKNILKGKEPDLAPLFPNEVLRTVLASENARKLNSAVLYDRDLDGKILAKIKNTLDPKKQFSNVGLLNLSLPFVKHIPPEKLTALRSEIPDQLKFFRHYLAQITNKALSEGENSFPNLQELVKREVEPELIGLKENMDSALIRARIKGYGYPIIYGTAVIAGSILSAPIFSLIGAGVYGVSKGLDAVDESKKAIGESRSHPLYFIWKAQSY